MAQLFADRLRGIHAATIVPMTFDFLIDEAALAAHIVSVASVPGINGLLVNGHAGENFVLSVDEKQRVVEIARRRAPKNCLIVSGVNHESSLEAALEAVRLEAAGADSLLVFPPNSWALPHAESCVIEHHRRIRDATRVPLMLYAAPVGAGAMAYGSVLLERLVSDHRYVAIKEASWEVATYEQNLRLIRKLRPDFIMLSSGDEHLLTSYIIGTAGSQVSLAAIVPEPVVGLWCAAEAGDWRRCSCHTREALSFGDGNLSRRAGRTRDGAHQGLPETSRAGCVRRSASAAAIGLASRAARAVTGAASGRLHVAQS